MNTDKLLKMLLEAIDYSFFQTDGSYDKTLTYPVIDKIKYIKEQVKDIEVKDVDLEEEVDKWYNNEAPKEFENILYSDIENFAKYFFELGLKTKE